MRTRIAITATALACLALAGCEPSSDPSPSASPSATASATASATPSEVPSATPSPTPDADALLITTTGVGPFTTDMTAADVTEVTGVDYSADLDMFEGACAAFLLAESGQWAGMWGFAESAGSRGPVDVYGFSSQSGHRDPGATTVEGLGIGSTLDQLETAYGDALQTRDDFYAPERMQAWVEMDGAGIAFDLDESDTVDGWAAGRLPQLLYIEGCA